MSACRFGSAKFIAPCLKLNPAIVDKVDADWDNIRLVDEGMMSVSVYARGTRFRAFLRGGDSGRRVQGYVRCASWGIREAGNLTFDATIVSFHSKRLRSGDIFLRDSPDLCLL